MRSVSQDPGQSQEYSCFRTISPDTIQLHGPIRVRVDLNGPDPVNGYG